MQPTNMRSMLFSKNLWFLLLSPICFIILQSIPAFMTNAQTQQVLMIDSLEMKFSKVSKDVLGSFTSFKYPKKSSILELGCSYFNFPVRYSLRYLSQFLFTADLDVTWVRQQAFFLSTVTFPVMLLASTQTIAYLSSICWVSSIIRSAGAFYPFSRQRISPSLISPQVSPDISSPSLKTFEPSWRNLLLLTFQSALLLILSKQYSLKITSSPTRAN